MLVINSIYPYICNRRGVQDHQCSMHRSSAVMQRRRVRSLFEYSEYMKIESAGAAYSIIRSINPYTRSRCRSRIIIAERFIAAQ